MDQNQFYFSGNYATIRLDRLCLSLITLKIFKENVHFFIQLMSLLRRTYCVSGFFRHFISFLYTLVMERGHLLQKSKALFLSIMNLEYYDRRKIVVDLGY